MLLVTHRDDELGPGHPLRVALGDLATQRATRRVTLPRLSNEGVRSLAAGRGVDSAELYRLTGGNPFYVAAALEASEQSVPPTIRDAVLARGARLSPEARRALEAAAVIGVRVEPWLLESVIGPLSPAVDECLASGMLVSEEEHVRFRHELARMAVVDSLPAYRGIELHGAVLDALEAASTPADQARLAHHAENAGRSEAVLRYAPEAARVAAKLGAHREAADQYRRVLRFADGLPSGDRASLRDALGYECYLTQQMEEALEARRRARDLWREENQPGRVGECTRWISRLLWYSGRGKEADEAGRSALDILEPLPPGRELAWAYGNMAQLRMLDRDAAEAIHWAKKAVDLAELLGETEVLTHALSSLGAALVNAGDEEGWETLERALQIALAEALEEGAARAYLNLYDAGVHQRRFAKVENAFVAGMWICDERDLDIYRIPFLARLATSLLYQGRWGEALRLGQALLRRGGLSAINRIRPLVVVGSIRARRGEPGVWEALDEAAATADGTSQLQWTGAARIARAEAHWLAGRPDRVADEVEPAYRLALRYRDPWTAGGLALWMWKGGRLEAAPEGIAEPFARQIRGDWEGAAGLWSDLGRCPNPATSQPCAAG